MMATGGDLLTGNNDDMLRSIGRIKGKLPTDGPDEYSGPSPTLFNDCTNKQKGLGCYYKVFRFLYGVGHSGVRIALPACCVLRIQNAYADPEEPATFEEGFIEGSFQDGLKDLPLVSRNLHGP